ncbi:MAG: hypothetical protein IPK63_22845 [Candidatus Competibacteraceae bacterium]|nr:hypothetical protein [Candidatus Competibacteraceae bacterium]
MGILIVGAEYHNPEVVRMLQQSLARDRPFLLLEISHPGHGIRDEVVKGRTMPRPGKNPDRMNALKASDDACCPAPLKTSPRGPQSS